jgi:hypothetical protein
MVRESRVQLPSDRSFGLTIAVALGLIGAWLSWRDGTPSVAVLSLCAAFLLAALAFPGILHPLNVAWMWLGHLLNRVVSPIVMGILFFGLLTPLAVLMRLRGRDVLQRRFDAARESYWIKRIPPGPDGTSFPRQY